MELVKGVENEYFYGSYQRNIISYHNRVFAYNIIYNFIIWIVYFLIINFNVHVQWKLENLYSWKINKNVNIKFSELHVKQPFFKFHILISL